MFLWCFGVIVAQEFFRTELKRIKYRKFEIRFLENCERMELVVL